MSHRRAVLNTALQYIPSPNYTLWSLPARPVPVFLSVDKRYACGVHFLTKTRRFAFEIEKKRLSNPVRATPCARTAYKANNVCNFSEPLIKSLHKSRKMDGQIVAQ